MAERQPYRWEDLEDEFRASAEAYREVSNELGLAFRHAQGEAYTSYHAWERTLFSEHMREARRVSKLVKLKKKYLVPLILILLKDEEMNDYQISNAIEQRVMRQHASSIIPILYGLQKSGFIIGEWRMNSDGEEREYFRLTSEGYKVLEKRKKILAELAELINIPKWQHE